MLRISRILAAVSAPVLVAGLALTGGPAQAASGGSGGVRPGLAAPARVPAPAAASRAGGTAAVTYVVRAYIDGHSRLTLRDGTARWYQLEFDAPGRWGGKNLPTIINGTKWFPQWPQPGLNQNCDCHSRPFYHLTPPVPAQADAFFVHAVRCRDTCSARYADGVLCINFNDDPSPGPAWYQVKVILAVDEGTRLP
jgi:hypothetical protein